MPMRPRPALDGPALPCPACLYDPLHRGSRIGNRRGQCRVCNAFASSTRRETAWRLREAHPGEYQTLLRQVERELYLEMGRDYLASHPPIEELLAIEAESWAPLTPEQLAFAADDPSLLVADPVLAEAANG